MKLPGASELFRPTGIETSESNAGAGGRPAEPVRSARSGSDDSVTREPVAQASAAALASGPSQPAGGTGRVRHDEKITVYVSREELLALEQARLRLRGELGVAVDRGRLVRAAMALALADLDAAGESSEFVRRLTAS